jgi:uncharacterized protein (DUF2141 family)
MRRFRLGIPFALAALGLLVSALLPAREAEGARGQDSGGELHWILLAVDTERGGSVRCALYRNEHDWLNRARAFRKSSARASNRQVRCVFRRLPAGTYAMAALHDADGDREMDKTLIGLPEEGFAISNDERDRMSAPDFDDAAVQFDGSRARYTSRMYYRRR